MVDDNPFGKHKKPAPQNEEEEDNPFGKHKKPAKKDYTWGEALRAAPGSAMQGIADVGAAAADLTYDSITDPAGTWKRMGNAAGSMVPAMVTTGIAMSPWAKALPKNAQVAVSKMSPPIADLVGQYYAGYLDGPELRRRIAEHPIATAADIATVGTLPGIAQAGRAVAAKLPAAAAHAANAARYVAVPSHAINDAAGFAAGKVVPWAANRVVNALNPTKAMVNRNLEGRGPEVLKALKKPKRFVPGSEPTVAQGATAADAPRFVAIAQAAQKRNPAAHLDVLNKQHKARVDHLRSIADDSVTFRNPDDPVNALNKNPTLAEYRADLVDLRDANKISDYGLSDSLMGQTTQGMYDILERPLNSGVLGRAEDVAASVPRPFNSRYTPAQPQQVIPDPFGQNLPPTIIPAKPAVYPEWSGKDIDTVKKAFDDLVYTGRQPSGGLGPEQIRVIRDNREAFLEWAHSVIPEYTAARANFAATSKDIDRVDLVKYLEERLQSPAMGESTIAPRADVFANAVREAAGANPTVNAATGEKRFNNLSDRFSPGQMRVTENIQDDMGRAQLADAQGNLGSHYSSEIDAIASEGLGFSPNNAFARSAMGPVNRYFGDKAVQSLSTTQDAAKMVEAALNFERMKSLSGSAWRGGQMVNAMINPARWANRYPAFYNALPLQQQQPDNALAR